MRRWAFVITFAFLFVLAFSRLHSAVIRVADLRPDLVAAVNMTPGNPLGGKIWLISLDGKLLRRLTDNKYYEEHPRFSPDGNKVVFVRNMGGLVRGSIDPQQNEIFVHDLRTGKETRLTRNDAEDGHPEWSYDGSSIAFFSRRGDPGGKATLWLMRADGSNPRQVTQLTAGDLSHLDPNWSPDGAWLSFVNFLEKEGMSYSRIEKIRLDGTQRTVVSSGGRPLKSAKPQEQESWGDLDPNHSPDGRIIWSARRLGGGQIHLYSFGAGGYYSGKAETDMTLPFGAESIERAPSFSPDGKRILLTRVNSNAGSKTRQLVLTDARSSFRRYIISRDDWEVWDPSWHPFAQSGAERDDASVVVTYNARAVSESDGNAAGKRGGDLSERERGSRLSRAVQTTSTTVQYSGSKGSGTGAYEARWKLEAAPQRVLSMTLRFRGNLGGGTMERAALRFQLMDWGKKNWVEVLMKPEVSHDRIEILHEFAPASFVNSETHEVALRLVVSGAPTAQQAPTLDFDLLSLDVKRD